MEFKNDLGKPWRYKEDGFEVTRTSMWSPPGCHPVGCGLKLYVKDGVLDHVEGDENNPVTQGRLCPRCLTLKDYVYNPSRIVYPMKRNPADRGKADKWERISWDEAFALIKEKKEYYTREYGPECMAVFCGTGRSGGTMAQEMAQAVLGTPNACYTQSGFACYQPRSAACTCVLGAYYPEIDYAGGLEGTYDNPNYQVPKVLVMWGKEPLPSNGDGLWGHAVIDLMKRGTKLISVDPRVNWLATRSTVQCRVRPGTDAALAMAWLNIIISEDLYDHNFVEKWCYGFEELAERVKDMSPEKAAEICAIPVKTIYTAARLYATAKPAGIAWGLALDQSQNGNQAGHCVLALMAITGNIDVPGGQIIAEIPAADAQRDVKKRRMGWNSLSDELRKKTIGMAEYPMYVNNINMAHADMMLEALCTGQPYQPKMGWIQSTNLLAPTCAAEPSRWYEGLLNLEWTMATDCFMTPSIQGCADLFLPLASCAEKDDVNYTHYSGSPVTVGAVNKAIEVGETKSDAEILVELGTYLGSPTIAGQFNSGRDFVDKVRAYNSGKDFGHLAQDVVRQRGVNYRKYETGLLRPDRQPGFLTPTGRVELYSTLFAHYGEDPLPFYQEPAFSPISRPDLAEKYPFILTTGARTYAFFHSEHRQIPLLRELNPNPLLELNPADAVELGVSDGQWVEIANELGAARFKAKLSIIVKRGVVMAQHGWWFPEQEGDAPNLYGVWQSNCNDLVPNHYNSKLGYGAPFKCEICSVTPLLESHDVDMQMIAQKFGKLVD
jgi:anaerobic selenocysteine-containing dehydrogenase